MQRRWPSYLRRNGSEAARPSLRWYLAMKVLACIKISHGLRHRHAPSLTSFSASSLNSRPNCRLVPIPPSGFRSP